ncbi:uncharacterized protein Dwil_GK26762 [Drosophila willistoni]|uniref:C-type lectin domain-containing protein n=1 Tax=Drosophila willistoni TaxID=7260 RepID=A0A0Q9X1U3_DROWI|nr:C-type lectin 37Da [Drosophila willistoni]KRF98770.1 uncharacterized protein Dwil_GK26762 [Drosophila willistoni]
MASTVQPIGNNTNFTVYSPTNAALGPRPLFTQIGNKFYFIETEVTKNWHDAYATCRQMGAHLISFDTADEWVQVTNYLVKNKIISDIWTSGSELAIQGNHVWFPTTDPIALNLWKPGEPNNRDGVEHCDVMTHDGSVFTGLNDVRCDRFFKYICQLSN